jgi:hypothetical protein
MQEPTFNLLVAAKGEARGRAVFSVCSVAISIDYFLVFIGVDSWLI